MENNLLEQYCRRTDRWSVAEWEVLCRLVDGEPGTWLKPIVSDHTGGLNRRTIPVVGALLEEGMRPRPKRIRIPDPDGERTRASVGWVYGEVECYASRDRDELWAEIRDLPSGMGTHAALARLEFGVPHLRRVENRAATITFWVGVPVGPDPAASLLQLHGLVDACRQGLADRGEQGFADLADQFVRASLAVPHLPGPLARQLKKRGEWCWSTLPADGQPQPMDDYQLSTEWLEGVVPDHVTISHAGHGINSYALTLRMVWGPVALIAQGGWGGAFSGPRDNGRMAELFAEVARVVRALEEREGQPRRGPRRRTLLVEASPMRGVLRVRRYDPVSRGWTAVHLSGDDPWETIAELAGQLRLNP